MMKKRVNICVSCLAFVAVYFGFPFSPLNPNLDEPAFDDVSAFVQSRLNDPTRSEDHILSLKADNVLTVTGASNLSVSRISYSNIESEDDGDSERVLFAEISADLSLKDDDGATTTQTVNDQVIQIDLSCFEESALAFRIELNGIVFSPEPDWGALARWKDARKIFEPMLLLISFVFAAFAFGIGVFIQRLAANNARAKTTAA